MLAAELGEVLRHPLVVGLALIFIPGGLALGWKVWRGIDALLTHVLPHFQPPKHGEPDNTLPKKVDRVASEQVRLDSYMVGHVEKEEGDVQRIDGRLAKIEVATETTAAWVAQHAEDAAKRDEAIARHDERLNALERNR